MVDKVIKLLTANGDKAQVTLYETKEQAGEHYRKVEVEPNKFLYYALGAVNDPKATDCYCHDKDGTVKAILTDYSQPNPVVKQYWADPFGMQFQWIVPEGVTHILLQAYGGGGEAVGGNGIAGTSFEGMNGSSSGIMVSSQIFGADGGIGGVIKEKTVIPGIGGVPSSAGMVIKKPPYIVGADGMADGAGGQGYFVPSNITGGESFTVSSGGTYSNPKFPLKAGGGAGAYFEEIIEVEEGMTIYATVAGRAGYSSDMDARGKMGLVIISYGGDIK